MSATTEALAELTPDRLVRQLAEVVRLGCRAFAERAGSVPQELADLQVDLHLRAAAVQLRIQEARAGSGLGGTSLDRVPEPASPSADAEDGWLSTGQVGLRTGLSTSYLRRLARDGYTGARSASGGYEWDPARLPGRRRAA